MLRYLKDTTSFGVSFHSSPDLQLTAYADANWAGCLDDRRSTSGHYIFFGSNLVSWSFSKQKVVSRSSIEVEYRALANAAFELQWIQHFLQEFSISSSSSPILFYNNLSTTFLAPNPIFHSRVKHVELDCHFVWEKVLNKTLVVQHIPSCDQIVDTLTKALPVQQFLNLRSKLTILTRPLSLRENVKPCTVVTK